VDDNQVQKKAGQGGRRRPIFGMKQRFNPGTHGGEAIRKGKKKGDSSHTVGSSKKTGERKKWGETG